MFATLYSLSTPQSDLLKLAQDYSPRFEAIGPLVMIDISGLSRLFGTPREIGEQIRRSAAGAPIRIAIAPSQNAAALLALGRPGLTVVAVDEQARALAALPVHLLGELDRLRTELAAPPRPAAPVVPQQRQALPPNIAGMDDVLPYFTSALASSPAVIRDAHGGPTTADVRTGMHASLKRGQAPALASSRDAYGPATADVRTGMHPSQQRGRTAEPPRGHEVTAPRSHERPFDAAQGAPSAVEGRSDVRAPRRETAPTTALHSNCGAGWSHPREAHAANAARKARRPAVARTESPASVTKTLLLTLRRWGVKTLGALATLPPGDVYERLGARGVLWQRIARGQDEGPLVPWVLEDPFESALELEWPIEGLEPLSFVLARLFEPLAERLERADRGAAILHTHLRLTTRAVHARTLQLPAPMRDPKTLRTLVLLDLESNPPSAAIDCVRVLVEPTPARVLQWTLFERAQPSPEQVSTLIARLTALMGEGHVGSPQLVDSWKPGAFAITEFQGQSGRGDAGVALTASQGDACLAPAAATATALRRFRLPVPIRVQVQDGRPVRVMTDRRGISGGAVTQAAGPWRTSGEWWNDAVCSGGTLVPPERQASGGTFPAPSERSESPLDVARGDRELVERSRGVPSERPHPPHSTQWDRDEWDIEMTDGALYRIFVERDVGQWFIEGVVD